MKKSVLLLCLLLPMMGYAKKSVQAYDPYAAEQHSSYSESSDCRSGSSSCRNSKEKTGVFTGFSFGLLGNLGYGFSKTPEELYNNGTLTNISDYATLPKSNITLGAGVLARIHLLNHIHVGAEGYLSSMPLMKSGSSVRHSYGGALIDGYLTIANVVLELGTGLGGGKVKRMFVPEEVETTPVDGELIYNASYTTTPYFYLDPYLGVEVKFGTVALMVKLDYQLPFGKSEKNYIGSIDLKNWSSFITPSGPRLHVGVMIGK